MGLDINLFRPEKGTFLLISPLTNIGGNPDLVRESVKKRFQDPKIVDDVMALDEEWRKSIDQKPLANIYLFPREIHQRPIEKRKKRR